MIVQKSYSQYIVFHEDTLASALQKISLNQHRMVFVVTESGHLSGALTDGDVRRWLLNASQINLDTPVSQVMNATCISAFVDDPREKIAALLSSKVLAVPLLDINHRVVAVAIAGEQTIQLGDRRISADDPAFVIAEIGNNHNGSLEHAIRLIDLAAEAGVDCAKFQMRDMKAMYRKLEGQADAKEDLGAQYTLDLLAKFQLSDEDLYRAFDHCQARNLVPLCTPWDEECLHKLDRYGMPGFKIASADFTNYDLLSATAALNKPMFCSTGMTSENEIMKGIELLQNSGCPHVLLHCNSTYPTPDKDVNLRYMTRLAELSHGVVGYSGHERGIQVPIAAVALGARVIEKHFTTDRGMEGNDHKVSLLPDELAEMVRGIRQIEEAMGSENERELSQGEMMNREVLAKSLIATVDIPAGTTVTADMVDTKSPGQGMQPNRKGELIGAVLTVDKQAGDFFFPSDLESESIQARDYSFDNPWGIPVRYHDLMSLSAMSNMDLLEIHLSYKDMELDFRKFFSDPLDMGLVVHAPELFSGDHTLDLCSPDPDYRKRSISEMQRVIDLTRELNTYFARTQTPPIVTNVGGFTTNGALPPDQRAALYDRVAESLSQLDCGGVEIIPQTMPPFPWHFGGQSYHNLFVDGDEIDAFCKRHGMRVCLDVSHSKLACTHSKKSFGQFLEKVAPHTAHYHLADAKGVDGEGLQILSGETDWKEVIELMQKLSPRASFIPEIWQGHKNNGEGAWIALERLERIAHEGR
ncbi:N-acetylneuraminate synthase family protein [Parvularcula marina]|uniref:CBS domain-containing protein n=1 Tax=Parvularcula marina TaxID=2292771 RepID=A0A371RHJ3_9PROT|nr:N-acetylneuraminate synthase family protein [Parvularcula marina]RFB04924.1 CBS domain-containing protein [Parvularcula marina]